MLIVNCRGNFLYLRRTFHEALRSDTGDTGDWERLPLANTLQKLRLENTKVGWTRLGLTGFIINPGIVAGER